MAEIAVGLDAVKPAESVVVIGFFDGVHRGHQSLITRAVRAADQQGIRCVVVTFDRHPLEVVNPGARPPLLMTLDQRLRALAALEVDLVVALPFDDELRHREPGDFITHVLGGPLQARHVVVGANFRFGHRAAGDVTTLADIGPLLDFTSEGVTLLELDDTIVSSTQIRAALERGDVEQAARWLGRPYVMEGIIARGDQRGRLLGFPTANLHVDERAAVPADGVYAGRFRLPESGPDHRTWHPCAISVGTNPTFAGITAVRIEANLLDWSGELYGVDAALAFTHRLRGQVKFDAVDDLVAQMTLDVARARELLA
ncbi:bifunctional riboflavin kinase/FAD synthetase [Euzebya tangerina]|uniref:bifunctional riboflavin kinase/FAD synthetase n=1 Tax=Euzebya tangerina TaxID=591198 RepID=UPI000E31E8B0|nr:bifunctional riboflavin kinase/FAD synthetase [Euzebya tangerina]